MLTLLLDGRNRNVGIICPDEQFHKEFCCYFYFLLKDVSLLLAKSVSKLLFFRESGLNIYAHRNHHNHAKKCVSSTTNSLILLDAYLTVL